MTYEEIIRQAGKQIEPKVYYYLNNTKIEIDVDDFKTAKPKFNAKLLGTAMRGLEIELSVALFNTAIYLDILATFDKYSAVKTYGPYYFKEKPTYNADTKTYTHKLYDEFIKTMVDYEEIEIDYPCTIYNYFKKLVETLGLTTEVSSLVNGNLQMKSDIYSGIGFTYRDVLEDIAQANGILLYVEGKEIKIAELGNDGSKATINDDILKNSNIDFGEHFGPINTIVLSRSADSDAIDIKDEQSILQHGIKELKIRDNQLMNDNDRSDFLPALLEKLKGIEYDIFDTELVGYGGFKPLQKVEFQTGKNFYNSYVFNNEIEITQGYKEVIYTDKPEETTTDYKATDKTDRRVNQLYIIANKQEQRIEALASEVTETCEKTNILEMTVDGTKQIVSSMESSLNNTEQDITQIKNSVENLTTATQQQINVIKDTIDNGVSKVVTTSSTFDENGLSMEKTGEQMSSKLDWDGFDVTRDKGKATETNMLSVRSDGVNAENVTVRAYLTQRPIRREKGIAMSDGTSVGLCEYWVG